MLKDTVIGESFNNQFNANAIQVTAGNANYWFMLTHIVQIISKNSDLS